MDDTASEAKFQYDMSVSKAHLSTENSVHNKPRTGHQLARRQIKVGMHNGSTYGNGSYNGLCPPHESQRTRKFRINIPSHLSVTHRSPIIAWLKAIVQAADDKVA